MSITLKLLIGLAAVWLAAWIDHGPLQHGARTIARLQAAADAVVTEAGIPGVQVRFGSSPLTRVATLSGPADDFQRNGMGGQKGLTQRVAEIEGVAGVRWADRPEGGFAMPVVAESLLAATIAYLAGLALAWLFWGRPRREGFA